jgi:uncharacterized glyoxalase superfamily protein PhnB
MAEPTVYPFLHYHDAPGAMEWLTKVLGFETTFTAPGPDNTIDHAEMRLGNSHIMLSSALSSTPFPRQVDDPSHTNLDLYVAVDDIDAHYQRAVAAGAMLTRDLVDATGYESRGFSTRDPEGHHWSLGTYRAQAPGS